MITYYPTTLEDYIESLYKHMNINSPHELDIMLISERLNIKTYFHPDFGTQAMNVLGRLNLNIDPASSEQEQWQDFGHELCHLLRQVGSQLNLPDEFISFQEDKADNFSLHFCIPTFMLERMELSQYRSEAIKLIAETFNVTFEFAKKRLEKHEQQLLGSQYSLHLKQQFVAQQELKKAIGYDYLLVDKKKTYLLNHNKGLLGIIDNRRYE